MGRHLFNILRAIVLLLVFSKCAQIVPLNGGKRDIKPPVLIEALPANKTVNFNAGEIILKFDEYVKLADLTNQLNISPKLKTAPEITAEGKKILIRIKRDELQPGTTYGFNFGNAITDMTEGNAIKGFNYVFSTGAFIDSLIIKGNLSDAFTNSSAASVLVALYENDEKNDSLPFLQTPQYYTRSGDDGSYKFMQLPVKAFKLFAFTDKNKNFLYDGDAETVAFYGPPISLQSDTTLNLKLFQEEVSKSYLKKTVLPYYGIARLLYSKKSKITVKAINPRTQKNICETNKQPERDTVDIYYYGLTDTLQLAVENKTAGKTDTLKLSLPRNLGVKRNIKGFTTNLNGGKLPLNETLQLQFPVWMDTSYKPKASMRLISKKDSLISTNTDIKGRWTSITTYQVMHKFEAGQTYKLKTDSNAFRPLGGGKCDSSVIEFMLQPKTDFGKVTLKLKLNKKQSYIVQLLNNQQKVTHSRNISFSLSSSNAVTIDFTDVLPGNYTLKVIYDNNENKTWDTGRLIQKILPEQVFIAPKVIKVISDWDVEEEITVKE